MTYLHWFYVLVAVQVLDFLTTYFALKDHNASEANGLLKPIMNKIGVVPALVVTKIPTIALFWFYQAQMPIEILWAMCAVGVYVVGNNINVIRRG